MFTESDTIEQEIVQIEGQIAAAALNDSIRPARPGDLDDLETMGAIKAELLDLTIMERNKHAKAVVQDIEAQRKEAQK